MTLARVEERDSTVMIVNANPTRRGALSPDLYAAIGHAAARANDPKIRTIIFASEGGFFCSGGDLNTLSQRADLTMEQRLAKVQELHDLTLALRRAPVPVIAAIEGGAAGAGLSLALACDLIVADPDAHFTAAYVKAGLVPDGGLTAALARMLPRQLTAEMCLLGRPVTAARLAELGVIHTLSRTPLAEAEALAAAFARGPRQAQATIKGLINSAYDTTEGTQLDNEKHAMAHAVVQPEAQIGITAFLAKKTPQYP